MSDGVAAVLGVGPGLGAAIARRFAGEGFGVALMARSEESVAPVREEIEDGGGTALPVSTDATDPDSVAAAFDRVRDELEHRSSSTVFEQVRSLIAKLKAGFRHFFVSASCRLVTLCDYSTDALGLSSREALPGPSSRYRKAKEKKGWDRPAVSPLASTNPSPTKKSWIKS
jgi:NAD(P)-dependent dehydrogenase (short-subunit alcohol dehydrogenase family)